MLNTVIKGCSSIEEFKKIKDTMERLTAEFSQKHMKAFENWTHGEPVKVWFDHTSNICIEYADGTYWHYNEKGEWF